MEPQPDKVIWLWYRQGANVDDISSWQVLKQIAELEPKAWERFIEFETAEKKNIFQNRLIKDGWTILQDPERPMADPDHRMTGWTKPATQILEPYDDDSAELNEVAS